MMFHSKQRDVADAAVARGLLAESDAREVFTLNVGRAG
jgi:hypothetical protein